MSCLAHATDGDPFAEVFHDVEHEARLRQTQIDAAAPEPGSFTALGVAPFQTAQTLSPFDRSFAIVQSLDGWREPRTTLGIDFSSLTLLRDEPWHLSDYKGHHDHRVVARAQLSIAASLGEDSNDRSLRVAPALRVVLHQERDPRVHRGPGSLEDCFVRNAQLPDGQRAAIADLGHRLDAIEHELDGPMLDPAVREATFRAWQILESQWEDAIDQYRRALRASVGGGMAACRDDQELAAYAWNSTGLVVGGAPTLVANDGRISGLVMHGYAAWATASYGFDWQGRMRDWSPGFFGRHAQILGQFTFRHDQLLPQPGHSEMDGANQYEISARLRGGTSPFNGSFEASLLRDAFDDGDRDTYTGVALGADLRLHLGTWLSASVNRTFSRRRLPDATSLRVSVQWSAL